MALEEVVPESIFAYARSLSMLAPLFTTVVPKKAAILNIPAFLFVFVVVPEGVDRSMLYVTCSSRVLNAFAVVYVALYTPHINKNVGDFRYSIGFLAIDLIEFAAEVRIV